MSEAVYMPSSMLSSFIDKKTSFPLRSFMSLCSEEVIGIFYIFSDCAAVLLCWAGLSFVCLEEKLREDSVAHEANKGGLTPVW